MPLASPVGLNPVNRKIHKFPLAHQPNIRTADLHPAHRVRPLKGRPDLFKILPIHKQGLVGLSDPLAAFQHRAVSGVGVLAGIGCPGIRQMQ